MPIAIQASDGSGSGPNLKDIDASSNMFVYTTNLLAFSGSYPGTPGDTLDLTPLAALVPSGLLPISVYVEGNGPSASQQGNGGYYSFSKGAALNNNKVRVWTAGGSEISTAAYPSAVLTDVVTLNITWRKFQ